MCRPLFDISFFTICSLCSVSIHILCLFVVCFMLWNDFKCFYIYTLPLKMWKCVHTETESPDICTERKNIIHGKLTFFSCPDSIREFWALEKLPTQHQRGCAILLFYYLHCFQHNTRKEEIFRVFEYVLHLTPDFLSGLSSDFALNKGRILQAITSHRKWIPVPQ